MKGVIATVLLGVGATFVMDVWALLQNQWLGIPSLEYRLVGRWIGHFPKGRLIHDSIGGAEPVPGEVAVGWAVHYAIGIVFAGILVWAWGLGWLYRPSIAPALIVGIGSIVAPFFIMQPGLGAGVAASRTPKPWLSRFRSFVAHTSFAIGLYLSGLVLSLFMNLAQF
nr:DUF2938 domain-containing protein [Phyllobacterium myrsinacearum]